MAVWVSSEIVLRFGFQVSLLLFFFWKEEAIPFGQALLQWDIADAEIKVPSAENP